MPPASSRPPWRLREADLGTVERLARGGNLPRPVARMLAARGHEDPARVSAHLEASLRALHDPRLLEGIGPASERIARALRDRETILIHGDYDVDGVTGTALLSRLFQLVGARSQWFIPNRFVHGYSFGPHSLEMARKHQARVVVSVDNGTSAAATIAELAAEGVDTIVTDHHEPPAGPLPIATAIVNPKLAGSSYPFRELCGAGVAFKLAWGVAQEISGARRVRDDLRLFLADAMSYVAIATVCDVVPLVDENRILARRGLSALEQTSNPGLRALLEVAQLDARTLLAEDVGFKLGPRLNASGRLGSAETAVETLLAPNLAEARRLAAQLDRMNDERRAIEGKLLGEALLECERFSDAGENPVLVVAGQGWHQGVVGVIAARLVERHRRPALVIGLDGPTGRGSARSVAGFSMLEAHAAHLPARRNRARLPRHFALAAHGLHHARRAAVRRHLRLHDTLRRILAREARPHRGGLRSPGPTFRHEQYAEYKATREKSARGADRAARPGSATWCARTASPLRGAGLRGRRRDRHAGARGEARATR
jgi:single-stranded-DNA-specific exonuclease